MSERRSFWNNFIYGPWRSLGNRESDLQGWADTIIVMQLCFALWDLWWGLAASAAYLVGLKPLLAGIDAARQSISREGEPRR